MPTYSIDYGGAQDGWASAASALASALTPDYDSQAKGRVMASQAHQNYAGAYANEQLGRERGAAAAAQERVNRNVADMDRVLLEGGITDPEERMALISERLPTIMSPDQLGSNFGDIVLAQGGVAGLGPERMTDLSVGAGNAYSSTPMGFDKDQRRQSTQFVMEQGADRAKADADRAAEFDRLRWETFNSPVTTGENATTFFAPEDPRYTPGGLQGQSSVGVNEQITRADGSVIAGPQFVPEAPKAPTTRSRVDGLDTVVEEWNGTGWTPVSRGPRSSDSGKTVTDPISEVFTADTVATLDGALAAGRDAGTQIGNIDQTMAFLQGGVPSGFWTDKTLPVRQALAGLGLVDEQKTAQIEALTADLGNRVMARIQETKGAVSNAEMDYFRKISASIGKTPGGNLMLLEKERRVWERAQRMRNFAMSLQGRNLNPQQISAELEKFKAANPLFTPEELSEIDSLTPDPERGYGVTAPSGPTTGTTSSGVKWELVE